MTENGYEYVDLGLPSKTMWATCNVGADKPEEYGLLFQFGRVDGYKYGDENHQFRTKEQNNQDTDNKYIPLTTSDETSRLWLRKFYWAKRLTVWKHGYFASTVGQVSEKIVWDYIENQGK